MRLKMFPLRCKRDVHQWLSLQYKRRSTLEEVWGWKCECEILKVKVWKCESYLVEAGEDWDEVDWMVVPPQAEVLCGRPTWHGGRVSETIQNCLRFIYVKISQNKHILILIWIQMKKATADQNRSRWLGENCASSLELGKIALRQLVQQSTLAGESLVTTKTL